MATAEMPADASHVRRVSSIAETVRKFWQQKQAFRVYHGSTNSTRKSPYQRHNIVDISTLNRVIKIDSQARMAYVEPNVPMDQLVKATLELGLMPPVVMEFPGITAGGGFAGTSGESSSIKYGAFDQTVSAVEVILGDGEVVCASQSLRPDLFEGLACSCGTLAIVTLLGIELIPSKPYVSVKYVKIRGIEEALERIKREQQNLVLDYIDGIFFSVNRGVLCLGNLVDYRPHGASIKRFSRATDNWFFINAEECSQTRDEWTEIIPLVDYLFRYDRGAFWMGKYTYRYFAIPLNRFTRWLLNRWTHTRMMYHALHQSGLSEKFVIQDLAVPYERSSELFSYLDQHFRNYPIWICPLQLGGKSQRSGNSLLAPRDHHPQLGKENRLMMNFGVWGPGLQDPHESLAWNQALETYLGKLDGRKWLYANTYYTADTFWTLYDYEYFDALRRKWNASHLPSLYDKVKARGVGRTAKQEQGLLLKFYVFIWSVWPLAGLYGWIQCMLSKEYLMS